MRPFLMCQFATYRFSLYSTFMQTGISYYFRVINTSPNQELITIGRSLYHCHIFCKRKGQFVGDFLCSSFKLSVVNISRLKNEFNPVIVTLNDQFVIWFSIENFLNYIISNKYVLRCSY